MEGLLAYLLIGGLFYFMMRFGCGSHMTHGKHESHGSGDVQHVDPVCGMNVDTNEGYGKMHEGELHRFCSRTCLDKFEADPARYLNARLERKGGAQ